MNIKISPTKDEMGADAAKHGAEIIRATLSEKGEATIIVATGASQFEMLAALTQEPDIDWSRVTGFHLDEYAGLSITHGASFRRYLWERFVSKLPLPMRAFHFLNAEESCADECTRVGALIRNFEIDAAFVGIGENGHLAFNDPPADFETEDPYIIVSLDEACRRQQLGEGWFPTLDDVPKKAISMSIRQIMKSRAIICTVPDARKADAVKNAITATPSPDCPASILQNHNRCTFFLDTNSARGLS